MVAAQYLRRRAPKGEPLSIIVINKSKIVSARYAICTFKTPQLTENVREAKNKESPTNLELVRNIHAKGVNRSTHRGRWCNQWTWVERQIFCDNDSNRWFIFLNSWKLRKSLQNKRLHSASSEPMEPLFMGWVRWNINTAWSNSNWQTWLHSCFQKYI